MIAAIVGDVQVKQDVPDGIGEQVGTQSLLSLPAQPQYVLRSSHRIYRFICQSY